MMSIPSPKLSPRFVLLFSLVAMTPWTCRVLGAAADGGTLCQGTRWETPYFVVRGEKPGPTVLVTGGVHGDEPAGAAAADQIRRWPIVAGTLIVLPRANVPGLAAHTRLMPGLETAEANLNRNFPKAGAPGPGVGELAQAIWAWVGREKPQWLIDLHEGTGVRGSGSASVGSSIIVRPVPEGDRVARLMLNAVNASIADKRKKFVRIVQPVDGSLARAAGEHLKIPSMIVETSINDLPPPTKAGVMPKPTKQQPISLRVRQHRIAMQRLLTELGMLAADFDVDRIPLGSATPDRPRVALYDAGGTGGQGEFAVERILRPEMDVLHVGPDEIAAGALANFQLVIVPGGSGSAEAAAIGPQGRQKIRQFIEGGGGYVGICAGAYLCSSGFDWSLGILNSKTLSPRWQRGRATLKIELTDEGRSILGDRPGLLDVLYHNGPVIGPAAAAGLPEYHVWAYFRTEVTKDNIPKGIMTGSPAIASGCFGRGRVVSISPHPEQTAALKELVLRAARWAVGKADGKTDGKKG